MVNVSSAVKKNTGAKHTRKELMNKSPIPWLVILIVTAISGGLFVYGDAMKWLEQTNAISEMETALPQLESEKQSLTNEKEGLEEAFQEKAAPFIDLANQRFPTEIDTTKVAQILEIYTILLQINNRGNKVELETLNINVPQNVDGEPYAQTNMNLSLSVDREMLEEYVRFLQTGNISSKLANDVLQKGGGETASVEFLQLNKLPALTIASMSLNEERSNTSSTASGPEIYNVQIQVLLHSQPI